MLPARLKDELDGVARGAGAGRRSAGPTRRWPSTPDWAEELKKPPCVHGGKCRRAAAAGGGRGVRHGLEHAGVFKRTPEGREAFLRFIQKCMKEGGREYENHLVAGGAGYIGSHMTVLLVKQGYEVVVVDNLRTGHWQSVKGAQKFCVGDLQDTAFLHQVFSENRIDGVINFAACSLVGESVVDPLKYCRIMWRARCRCSQR